MSKELIVPSTYRWEWRAEKLVRDNLSSPPTISNYQLPERTSTFFRSLDSYNLIPQASDTGDNNMPDKRVYLFEYLSPLVRVEPYPIGSQVHDNRVTVTDLDAFREAIKVPFGKYDLPIPVNNDAFISAMNLILNATVSGAIYEVTAEHSPSETEVNTAWLIQGPAFDRYKATLDAIDWTKT